jgi:hypothetical protein
MSNLTTKIGVDVNGNQYTRMVREDELTAKARQRLNISRFAASTPSSTAAQEELRKRVETGDVKRGNVVEFRLSSEGYDLKKWVREGGHKLYTLNQELGGLFDFDSGKSEIISKTVITQDGGRLSVQRVQDAVNDELGLSSNLPGALKAYVYSIEDHPDPIDVFMPGRKALITAVDNNDTLKEILGLDKEDGDKDLIALTEGNVSSEVAVTLIDTNNKFSGKKIIEYYDSLPNEYRPDAYDKEAFVSNETAEGYDFCLEEGVLDWDNDRRLIALDTFICDYVEARTGIER